MAPHSTAVQMQTLLDHQRWVEELARRLVRDPEAAADLAQETVLVALQHQGSERRSMRAWLATVMRNLVWERLRSEERRRARETAIARDERAPSTFQLVERMATHQVVVETVMELPELYRDILLHRYFEGQTPTEIAHNLDVPLSTVKTQLARALAAMRERLDRKHGGDGAAWLAALAPLAEVRGGVAGAAPIPAALGFAAGLTAAALAVAVLWIALGDRSTPGSVPISSTADIERPEASAASAEGSGRSALARTLAGGAPSSTSGDEDLAAVRSAHAPDGRVRGRVLDEHGAPIGGVVVRHEPYRGSREGAPRAGDGASIALTDKHGAFEFAHAQRAGEVRAVSDELVTVFAADANEAGELVLVVAPRLTLSGRVLDEQGAGLAGATVELLPPPGLRARVGSRSGAALDRAVDLRFRARSAADGAFDLAAPLLEGTRLVAALEGHAPYDAPAPTTSSVLDVLMRRIEATPGTVAGVVLDASGIPVGGARVACGSEVTVSDVRGAFRVRADRLDDFGHRPVRIVAVHRGHGPAVYELPARRTSDGGETWPEFVELRLARAAASIQGRVLDARGRPLRGVAVWVADPTLLRTPPARAGLDPNPESSLSVTTTTRRPGEVPDLRMPETVEAYLSGEDDVPWVYARTDAAGAFELGGLEPRAYRVAAMDFETLVRVEVAGVAAGTRALDVRLDTSAVAERLRGRVVDGRGRPVPGVQVAATACAFELGIDGHELISDQKSGARTRTASDGSFVLDRVPLAGAFLAFEGRGILPRTFGREGELREPMLSGAPLDVEVQRWVRLQIVLTDPDEARSFGLRDAAGEFLRLHQQRGSKRLSTLRAPLVDGVSEALSVSDAAAQVVLFDGDQELRSAPVPPATGGPGVGSVLRLEL